MNEIRRAENSAQAARNTQHAWGAVVWLSVGANQTWDHPDLVPVPGSRSTGQGNSFSAWPVPWTVGRRPGAWRPFGRGREAYPTGDVPGLLVSFYFSMSLWSFTLYFMYLLYILNFLARSGTYIHIVQFLNVLFCGTLPGGTFPRGFCINANDVHGWLYHMAVSSTNHISFSILFHS